MIYTELPLIFVRQNDKKFFKKEKKNEKNAHRTKMRESRQEPTKKPNDYKEL